MVAADGVKHDPCAGRGDMPIARAYAQGRWMQCALPMGGVVVGALPILGAFLATVARSVLVWDERCRQFLRR